LHSLFRLVSLPTGGVSMPLMICGSETDPVVSPPALHEWQQWLKPVDRLVKFPDGHHFFHYYEPERVGAGLVEFWQGCNSQMPSGADSSMNACTG
jgi:pimeloyl-ACP methyl ester carboxylesterase